MCKSQIDLRTDSIVDLGLNGEKDKIHWLGIGSLGSKLYVRPCYEEFYDICHSLWDKGTNLLIIGTSGIGKSMFRLYMFAKICQFHCVSQSSSFHIFTEDSLSTVIDHYYYDHVHKTCVVTQQSKDLLQPSLVNRDSSSTVYYIADNTVPMHLSRFGTHVKILEVSSPEPSRWHQFHKACAELRIMPLDSYSEILGIASAVNSSYTHDQILERFKHLGGSARNVLKTDSVTSLINNAMNSYKSKGGNFLRLELDASSILIHMVVDEYSVGDNGVVAPYSMYNHNFASRTVLQAIGKQFITQSEHQLHELLNHCDVSSVSTTLGSRYEDYLLQCFSPLHSQIYRMKELTSNSIPFDKTISLTQCKEFVLLSEVPISFNMDSTTIYAPISKTFGAVDMLTKDFVANITLNLRHGIALRPLEKLLQSLYPQTPSQTPQTVNFYWIVPTMRIFDKMTAQSFIVDRTVAKPDNDFLKIFQTRFNVIQFVVCIPVRQP